ncbi:hypothetical protein ACWGVR_15655 [Streptomyces xanthophaeus]
MANILNGKSFPAWPKMEALAAALLHGADVEAAGQEIKRIRDLWLDAHYDEGGSAPPVTVLTASADEAVGTPGDFDFDLDVRYEFGPSLEADPEDGAGEEEGTGTYEESEEIPLDEFRVRFMSSPIPGPDMFSVDLMAGMLRVVINESHPMGPSLIHAIGSEDRTTSQLVKNLLFSWARMEDEIPSYRLRNKVADIRSDWSRYARWIEEPDR